ncbi:MAG: hypothetical protein KDA66_00800 [Planctomycetaceae bacterium]|nr:hypothetical protein [Planctomycetaceae bacterium]
MPNTEQMHEELDGMIEAALDDQDHDSANEAFAKAEQLAHQILELNPRDAEACYAIALTWYHRWLPQPERRNCVGWLRKTAQLNPEHPWVPLYLGYQFWDDGQYAAAFAEFARVDQGYFDSIEHHWRNLKTRELMLCCRVLGGFATVAHQQLVELVADYIDAEIVDRPIPTELVKTLAAAEHRSRFDVEPRLVAGEMCRLIEGIGDQNVFAEQVAEFQSAVENAV